MDKQLIVKRLLLNTTPLCFTPSGVLVCYCSGRICLINNGRVHKEFPPFHSSKKSILSRFKLLGRLLRTGVRTAVALDDDNIVLSYGNYLYDFNLRTGLLSNGFFCGDGVRPLSFSVVKQIDGFDDGLYFGGYVRNFEKASVNIYYRIAKDNWEVVYTFPPGIINHVHNVVADPYRNCLWAFTGDFGDAAAIWKFSDGFRKVERFVYGNQKWRSCVAFAIPEGLLYATDTPFDHNHIYLLNDKGTETIMGDIPGSCIYGCQWKDKYIFSTVVEPDGRNETLWRLLFGWKRGSGIEDNHIHLYKGDIEEGFHEIYKEKKDLLPFIFQFGAFRFPSGVNNTEWLYFQQIATKKNDLDLIGIQVA